MIKKIVTLFFVTLTLLIISGCWSKKELNELALVAGMAIDKTDTGYSIAVQVISPDEVAGEKTTTRMATIFYKAESEYLCDAFRNLTFQLPRNPYLAHLLVVVISEEIAREGIYDAVDTLVRDDQLRPTTSIYIAKGAKAEDILRITTPLERVPMNKVIKITKNAETNYAAVHTINLFQLINSLVSDGTHSIIPGIEIIGDIEKGKKIENVEQTQVDTELKLTEYAVFKKDKLIGWLDQNTSKVVNYLQGEVKYTMINAPCYEDYKCSLEIKKVKSKVDAKIKDEKIKMQVEIQFQGNICLFGAPVDITKPKSIRKLEADFEKELTKKIEDGINIIQKDYQVDILGFGDIVHRKDPKLWKKVSKDWDQEFENLEVEVKVDVKIKRTGDLFNPIKESK